VVADARNVAAQEIAYEQHRPNPRQTADDVVKRLATVLHLPHTGHDRHKGADDGHEARKNDRLSTMSLVKRVSALEMLAVEEQRILTSEQPRAGNLPDIIADAVAQDRRNREQGPERVDVQVKSVGLRGEQPSRDQQRIAWEKEPDEQTCFGENDNRESDVAAPGNQGPRISQCVNKVENGLHAAMDEAETADLP